MDFSFVHRAFRRRRHSPGPAALPRRRKRPNHASRATSTSLHIQSLEPRLALSVNTGNAKPYWGNGHYYAFTQEDIDWSDAYDGSRGTSLNQLGTQGYLATITSSGENDFIKNYSRGGSAITRTAHTGGTDETSEGRWVWKAPGSGDDGVVFRSNGSTPSGVYANWSSRQPDNSKNQDYLGIQTDGKWDDVDHDNDIQAYVTEWGRDGVEFTAEFADLGSSDTVNGLENGQAARMTISFDRKVPSDYIDIRNDTPLIDIPITFSGTATAGTDYDMSVSGGSSYFRDGKLYVRNTQTVTLTFTPRNNTTWQSPRTIKATLGSDGSENIFGIGDNATSQVWIFDDEPLLSLGQGAYQFIRAPFTAGSSQTLPASNSDFSTSADTLIFDTGSIDESNSSFSDQGFYDSFAMRWETYVRIPETGSYTFRTSSDDGHKLTVRRNDSSGTALATISNWSDGSKTGSTSAVSLTKGDVVWVQFDMYEKSGTAAARLLWDRPDGSGGTTSNQVIPASAMFLSKALAAGVNRTESATSDTRALGFQLFANKSSSSDLNVKLASTSETSNSTVDTSLAQRRVGSGVVGDDYALWDDASAGTQIGTGLIGLNDSFATTVWKPDQAAGSLANVKSYYVQVLTDSYAEATESITLELGSNTGYGVSNDSQTISIADSPFVLSVQAGQNPKEGAGDEGDLGWFTITTGDRPAPAGLRVKYAITGGTATRNSDYTAPQATLSTTSYSAQDLVVIPTGATEARIYIAALADSIREGDETVVLELRTNVEQDNQNFTFQRYNVDASAKQATLTITDSEAFESAVVTTPADRTGQSTVRARLTDGSQVASFDVHVTSQPKTDVTVTLTTTSGSLSAGQLTFTGSNWTQPQRITLTGVTENQATTVRLTSTSGDSRYRDKTTQQRVVPSSWSSELELSLWEGGTVLAAQPAASVAAIDGTEGTTSRFGFELGLGAVATSSPVELLYTLAAGNGMSLAGTAADVRHSPDAAYHPLVLANSGSGDAAYADLGTFTTVSDAGELSGQAWVRRDKAQDGDTVLEFSNASGQHQIWLGFPDSTNKPRLQLRSSSGAVLARLTSDVPLAVAEWNHLAFSIDGNKVASLYVNGELVARQTLASGLSRLARSSNLLGRSLNGERLDGAVRGVAIWNAARTQDEIRASMLGETASGSGLVSSLPLNNSLANDVSSAPAAVLSSNSSNTAGFAAVPTYGLRLPAGASQVGVPLVVLDDLTAENDETLTLTLVDSGLYSLGGASSTSTAELADDDSADVEFLAAWSNLDATSSGWTSTGRFTVSESDEARSSKTRLGIRLTSRPTDTVTLRLETNTATSGDIRTTLAGSPTAAAIELVFTPDNWDQVQELLLQGRDDTSIDGDIERSLDFTITTTDTLYKPLTPSVTVLVLDDDTATANEDLAAAQNAQAPIAQISAPTRTTIEESGSDSAEFTITLSQPAAQDTLVFFDLEQSNRQLNARDFVVTPSQNAQALVGLARFEAMETTDLKINFQHPDAATPDGFLADSGSVYGDRGNSRTYGWSSDHTDLGRVHSINSDQLLDTHMHFQEGATWEVSLPNGVYEVSASVGDAKFSSTHTLNVEGVSFFSEQQLSANEFARTTATVTVSDGRLTLDQGSAARKRTRINYLEIKSTGGTGVETTSVDADGIDETSSSFPAAGGSFTTTWSGYIAVPETGSYTFTVPVRGGVRLVLDGTTVIDQWIDTQATWSTESLQLTRGDFVAVTLDYTSFNTAAPAVALQWERPRNNNADTVTETIPAEAFSRVDGIHLLIAAGSTSASVTVQGLDDSIEEDDETLVARLLAARGVELVVRSQTDATDGGTQLELALGTTDREAVTLAAGTVLALGRSVEISGSKGSTVARFTLGESVTLHRDRGARVTGTLAWVDANSQSSVSGSVVDLVTSVQGDLYQVLDRSVTMTLNAPLTTDAASGTDRYLASLTLGSTNRSSVELAAGTELVYRNDSTGDTATLVLVNSLSVESGQAAGSVPVRVEVVTLGLDLTSSTSPLTGLTSRVDLPTNARLTITDDDAAGIAFFLDGEGFEPADGSRVTLAEGGASLTRYVRLTSQPDDSVTLYLETNDASEARLQIPASSPEDPTARIALTFTPENWKVPQAFQIVPVDDRLVDGSQSVEIHARTTSSDRFYKIASAGRESLVARINFQLGSAETPDGYLADSGQVFGDRNQGWSYGWSTDHTDMGRDRNKNADQSLDTLIGIKNGQSWEIALDNGVYEVSASIGDAEFTGTHTLNIEGVSYFSARSLAANEFGFFKALVTVSDGRLTIDAGSSSATRINYLEIALSRPVAETLLLQDNDTSGVKVELQQGSIAKAGNGFINLSLTAEPTADVVVTLSPSDRQFTINDRSVGRSETLVFTPANWATLQTVGLFAVDDSVVEDVSTSSLTFATTSDDARFDGLAVDTVSIVITDNDLPTATLERISDGAEEGRPGRFRIRLSDATASSVGSKGLVVNYSVTAVDLDSSLPYGSSVGDRLGKIAQTPTSVSGTVRIPPGQAQSDVLVVPIDDFLADSTSKSITVALASGDGYTVGSDSSRTTATVKIINNDVAGILVMTSGERVFVKESGSSATYQLALTSEPKSTVTVTITEKVAGGASRQLGTSSAAFSTTVTFTRDNWFTPQQISVRAFDDYKIEDGSGSTAKTGIHAAQLAYRFSSSDTDYDTASHSGDSGHFTNFVQSVDVLDYELADTTATSMQSSLTSLQEGIDSLSLPMVGSLTGKTGQGLRKFINDLTNSIRQVGTPTPSRLSRLITRDIAAALGVSEDAISVSLSMKDTSTTNPAVVVRFGFSDAYTVLSVPLASDFGLPGLGFQTEGSFDAFFSYDAGLELVFPRSGDIYLNTADDKTFVTANFNAGLSENFSLTGGLGFMQLDAVNQPSVNDNVQIGDEPASTELDVSFELFVNGGAGEDGSLSYTELTSSSLDLEEVFQYSFSGNAAMSFGVTTSVNGSAAIPSFKFELSALLPLFDYSNQEQADEPASATTFYFDDIRLDLGSYITDMLSPIVDGLDGILKPLYPLVDALYKDTKIFATVGLEDTFDVDGDGQTSTIDLSRWFAGFYATIDRDRGQRLAASVEETVEFLDMLKGVMDLVRDLERLSDEEGFYVSFGSYELPLWNAGDDDADPADEEVDADAEGLSDDTKEQADQGGKDEDGNSKNAFAKVMDQLDELGITIPLIEEPANVVKLLFGQDVSLFEWRMPGMGMSSEIDKTFPIYGGIEGVIEGGYEVEAHLGFGFDTFGLSQWRRDGFAASSSWKVFNGFYVADLDKSGDDIPEFTMDASMGAGLGYSARVVRADITGGLEAAVSLDLLDEGEIAGTSDGKIRGLEITDRISNPLNLFELSGELIAYVKSRVQIGIDLGFYSIWETVWERRLAEIPIFQFGIGGRYGSGSVSNGHIADATVFFDANFNGRIDSLEPVTTSDADGRYTLDVDLRTFDRNRNGRIDADEGQLVVFGGTDTSMDQKLELPFAGPLGGMVTPLTTLHNLAVTAGVPAEEVRGFIAEVFELGRFDYLTQDPLRVLQEATSFDDPATREAANAYLAHVKLHFAWDLVSGVLQNLLPDDVPNSLAAELELLKGFAGSFRERPTAETLKEGFGRAIADAWKRANPDSDPLVGDLAAKAADMAAMAGLDVASRLDELRLEALQRGASPSTLLMAVNEFKRQAFQFSRTALHGISDGLYRISDPAEVILQATQRLRSVQQAIDDIPRGGLSSDIVVRVPDGEMEPLLVTLSGSDTLTKAGGGTLEVSRANTHVGGTSVVAGTLLVRNAAAFGAGPLAIARGATVVLDVSPQTVALAGLALADDARLDIGSARLEIAPGVTDAASLRSAIIAGRDGGTWITSRGIGSSTLASAPAGRAVGYLVHPSGGASLAVTTVGDLDLDFDFDSFDLVQLSARGHYGRGTPADWAAGDVNYDGVVNAFDLIAMGGGQHSSVTALGSEYSADGPAASPQRETSQVNVMVEPMVESLDEHSRLQAFRSLAAGISWGHVSPATVSVSANDRSPAVAPTPVTQQAALAAPTSPASRGDMPRTMPASRPARKASPAPVVSATGPGGGRQGICTRAFAAGLRSVPAKPHFTPTIPPAPNDR